MSNTGLTQILDQLDREVRDKHGQLQALDVQISARQQTLADLDKRLEKVQRDLAVKEPKYISMQKSVADLLKVLEAHS
jgi:hypothetical protein